MAKTDIKCLNYSSVPRYNHGLSGRGKQGRKDFYIPDNLLPKAEVLFGIHPVMAALQSGRRKVFHRLYVKKDVYNGEEKVENNTEIIKIKDTAQEKDILVSHVNPGVLSTLSGQRPHQGVCLDTSRFPVLRFNCAEENIKYRWNNKDRADGTIYPVWLLIYNIQDPMNLGAILRSANFLGVDQIIVPSINSCRMTAVVSKASSGAMEVLQINSLPPGEMSYLSFLQLWKNCGGSVVGTTSNKHLKSQCVTNYNITSPILLIMGNEGYGVDNKVLDECDTLFTISPVRDNIITSLNVSVTTGILLHHLLKKNIKL